MSVMTHDAKWRLLIGAAPVIGVAFFVWAAAQGDSDVARSPTARAILAGVAALGTVVAWWTACQQRAAPAMPVAQATRLARAGQLGGLVAMRGRARPLPDAVPLVSPDGELCLWFEHGERSARHVSGSPFLLVDDSGECIVLAAGADVTGQGLLPGPRAGNGPAGAVDSTGSNDPPTDERLLRNGDRIHVVGRFVAASPEALALQAGADALAARSMASQAAPRSGDPPPLVRRGIALPVLAAPGPSCPLVIRIGPDEGEGGLYGLLAVVDCVVLVVSSSLVAWSLYAPS